MLIVHISQLVDIKATRETLFWSSLKRTGI